ncbi:DUF4902 domain-containing protein [Trinickia caryophylli]|nr:DUF4902 domain-containing protein [Trinickia caryophylli]
MNLVHVDSGLDEMLLQELLANDVDAVTAGYTEWEQTPLPGRTHITLGWDWYLDRTSGALVVAWGDVRSNVMCIGTDGRDLGMARTAWLLVRRVSLLNWPGAVTQAALAQMPERANEIGPTLQ